MRRLTLMVAAVLLVATTAMSQDRFSHSALQQQRAEAKTAENKEKQMFANINEENKAHYLPQKETSYGYAEGEWQEDVRYVYTYDDKGNTLTFSYDDGIAINRTAYEYNADNLVVTQIESMSEDGGKTFVDSRKLTKTYDAIIKDFVVEQLEYLYNNNDWELVSRGYTWKKNITRDDKDRITGVTVASYYQGKFEDMQRTTITYNDLELADTWIKEELVPNDDNTALVWEKYYHLTKMEWQSTDNQITALELDEFYTGNNRLKKAVAIGTAESVGEVIGGISAQYEENGNYRYEYSYNDPVGREVFKHTLIDNNGGFTDESAYYEDTNADGVATEDEKQEGSTYTENYDEHLNIVSVEMKMFIEGADEVIGGSKFDYIYQDNISYPVEQIHSELNPDTFEWEPFIKVRVTEFVDILSGEILIPESSGVDNVLTDDDATTLIYNLQGLCLGNSLQSLPAGVYIVRTGDKVQKIMKY